MKALNLREIVPASSTASRIGGKLWWGPMDIKRVARKLSQRHPRLNGVVDLGRIVWRAVTLPVRRGREQVFQNAKAVMPSDVNLEIAEYGGRFVLSKDSHIFRRFLLHGSYESHLVEIVEKHLQDGVDFIDVGANIGLFSILAAKRSGDGRVLAVEPTANACRYLRENVDKNRVGSRVHIFEGCIMDYSGTVTIHAIHGMEEYSSTGPIDHPAATGRDTQAYSVPCTTLDELIADHDVMPGLIKIDAEGAEMKIFEGAHNTLTDLRPVIVCELSDALLENRGGSATKVIEFLEDHGYRVLETEAPYRQARVHRFGEILALPPEVEDA